MSIQAVLHTNNATVGAQNKENKIFKIEKHSNRNPRHFIATLKKRGGRRWIKLQICQLNTMQRNWKRSYSNYTQPVKSASHHQRRANQQASYAARDRSKQNKKKKVGSPPNRIHIIQKKKEEEEDRNGAMQEEPVHTETEKNTDMRWSTEWTTHPNANLLMNSNDITRAHKHAHLTIFLNIGSRCAWSNNGMRNEARVNTQTKKSKRMGGHHHSSKIKQRQRKKKTWNKPRL